MRRLYVLAILLALVLFFSMATGGLLFYRLLYVLAALILISVLWSLTNLRRLSVTVVRPHGHLQVGDTLESTVTLENPTVLPKLMLEVKEFTAIPGHSTSTTVNLRPFGKTRWEPKIVLRKRGVFPLGHLTVTSSDVFGVMSRQKVFPATEEIVVYPSVVHLPWYYIPQKGLLREGRARQPTHIVTPLAATIREYIQGDTIQHIHWPTTARKSRLMSKQFDSGVENRVFVLLDLDKGVQAGEGVDTTEEYVINAAASVINKFVKERWAVGMVAQGDEWYFIPPRDHTSPQRFLDSLARAQAQGSVPLASLLAGSEGFLPPPPFVLVAITPSSEQKWNQGLWTLQQRGAMVSVVIVDASSFGGPPGAAEVAQQLRKQGTVTYLVRKGEDLATALDYRQAISSIKEDVLTSG